MDQDRLTEHLLSILAEDQEPVVLIAADQMTRHKHVVALLDFLRENGVYKFAINTQPPARGKVGSE